MRTAPGDALASLRPTAIARIRPARPRPARRRLLRFAQRGAQLELDTLDANLRQAYRKQAEARIERWELMAQKLRVVLMPLSTQSDMIEQLREYLNAQRPRSAS